MNTFFTNMILAFIWATLFGEITLFNLITGFILGFAILAYVQGRDQHEIYFQKLILIVRFAIYFMKEIVKANILVAYDILTPEHVSKPGIVAIPLNAKTDLEIMLLANMITLTPGTLSLDVSDDRRVLYVHVMFLESPDRFRQEIKDGLEKQLLEVMR